MVPPEPCNEQSSRQSGRKLGKQRKEGLNSRQENNERNGGKENKERMPL